MAPVDPSADGRPQLHARFDDRARRVLIAAAMTLVAAAVPGTAAAQGPSLSALRSGVSRPFPADTLPPRLVPAGSPVQRTVLGFLGSAVGAVGGAALAVAVLPESDCGDDPGLCEALPGIAIGSIVGAGLAAALPRGNGTCEFRRRFPRGVIGAAVGYLFGAAVTGAPLVGLVIGGPIGAAVGGAVGANRCRAS